MLLIVMSVAPKTALGPPEPPVTQLNEPVPELSEQGPLSVRVSVSCGTPRAVNNGAVTMMERESVIVSVVRSNVIVEGIEGSRDSEMGPVLSDPIPFTETVTGLTVPENCEIA
jgi:hypothetical protein